MLVDKNFKPTWLYIKQHNITGLKYFGKTVRKDPIKYLGSGTYWNNHLKKHNTDITTIWCQLFTNIDELVAYAVKFSLDNNIVESSEWANLEIEDGLSGCGFSRIVTQVTIDKRVEKLKGKKRTIEQKERMRQAQLSRKQKTPEEKAAISQKISNALKGRKLGPKSPEHKLKLSLLNKGKLVGPRSEETKQKMRKPKTEEHRKAISEARKAKYAALRESRNNTLGL